jgi:hypothetical protein
LRRRSARDGGRQRYGGGSRQAVGTARIFDLRLDRAGRNVEAVEACAVNVGKPNATVFVRYGELETATCVTVRFSLMNWASARQFTSNKSNPANRMTDGPFRIVLSSLNSR